MEAVASDAALHATLVAAAEATADALLSGRKLMVAGNGGSAADAQHIAAEFVCRLVDDRPAMRAIALTTNTSILTAVANDYGFERLFARQIEALGQPGDVFIAISTSGNSPNILRALEQCRTMGIVTIGLTGKSRRQNASALRLLPAHAVRSHHVHPASASGPRTHLLAARGAPLLSWAHQLTLKM